MLLPILRLQLLKFCELACSFPGVSVHLMLAAHVFRRTQTAFGKYIRRPIYLLLSFITFVGSSTT